MGEEVPGYGSEMRLEDHCISAEGVSLFFTCLLERNNENLRTRYNLFYKVQILLLS